MPAPLMYAAPGCVMQEAGDTAPVLTDVRKAPQLFLAAAAADPPGHQLPLGHNVHAAAVASLLVLLL